MAGGLVVIMVLIAALVGGAMLFVPRRRRALGDFPPGLRFPDRHRRPVIGVDPSNDEVGEDPRSRHPGGRS